MDLDTLKVEVEAEACCICSCSAEELLSPEEYDSGAPPAQPPLRSMLLQLNNSKILPSGRLCMTCIRKAMDAYSFSNMLSSTGPPPLSEKIRALRKRLQELTQKIDVFIVVGGGAAGGAYSEEDIIVVERTALAAAAGADAAERARATDTRGDRVYQCTVCPASFQTAAEYRSHASSHPAEAPHSCWSCGAQFPTAAALAEHASEHRAAPDLVCHLCDQTFQSSWARRQHEAACERGGRCPECGRECGSRGALRAHAAGAHPALCGACFLRLPTPAACAAHRLRHRLARRYVCGYDACILRFSDRNNLLSHIRKCHGGAPPAPAPAPAAAPAPPAAPAPAPVAALTACPHCDRTFASVAAMKRHVRVHRDAPAPASPSPSPSRPESEDWTMTTVTEGEEEYLELDTLEEMDDEQ